MKKVLIVFLVFAYMKCYLGCTSYKMVRQSELNTENNDAPLMLTTTDSTSYYFEEKSYTFKNDTLIGRAMVNNESEKQWVKVPLADIEEISGGLKKVSAGKTAVASVFLVPLFGIIIIGVIFASQI